MTMTYESNRESEPILCEEISEILSRVDSLPTLDPRAEEELLSYDENGIPQSNEIGVIPARRAGLGRFHECY